MPGGRREIALTVIAFLLVLAAASFAASYAWRFFVGG